MTCPSATALRNCADGHPVVGVDGVALHQRDDHEAAAERQRADLERDPGQRAEPAAPASAALPPARSRAADRAGAPGRRSRGRCRARATRSRAAPAPGNGRRAPRRRGRAPRTRASRARSRGALQTRPGRLAPARTATAATAAPAPGAGAADPHGRRLAEEHIDSRRISTTAGTMNPSPPTTAPPGPATRQAQKIASWVEAGSGQQVAGRDWRPRTRAGRPSAARRPRVGGAARCARGPAEADHADSRPLEGDRPQRNGFRSGLRHQSPVPTTAATRAERGAVEPVEDPGIQAGGADLLVEVERGLVPIERGPLEARTPARDRDGGQVGQQRGADARASVFRRDVQILQPQPRPALPCREGAVEQREARGLPGAARTACLRDQRLGRRRRTE